MKWFLYITFVASLVTILLMLFQFKEISILEYRIKNIESMVNSVDSLNIESIKSQLKEVAIEKAIYLDALGRQSDWFIFYVTILFSILGLIGYGTFKKTINDIKAENNKAITDQAERQNYFEDKIFKLGNVVNAGHSQVYELARIQYKDSPAIYFVVCINLAFTYKTAYELNHSGLYIEALRRVLVDSLEVIKKIKENPDFLNDFKRDFGHSHQGFIEHLLSFSVIDNLEIKTLVANVISKLGEIDY